MKIFSKALLILLIFSTTSCSKKPKESVVSDAHYDRTKEQIQRVWFAPYVDEEGNQHEASYINVVVKNSKWSKNETKTQH